MGPAPLSTCIPWAVHVSDGVLSGPWLVGGFVGAVLLAAVAAYRVRDEEIPRIALLSAAFFVASLLHLPIGPTSVHLLLNGLVGVILGRRAPLAILIGLGLQAALLGHGGFTTIGTNACVLSLPAILAGWMFAALLRLPAVRSGGSLLWLAGCVIGMVSVLLTLLLQTIVLLWGSTEGLQSVVWFLFAGHLPIVVVEGIVVGFTVRFLARVKPEILGLSLDIGRQGQAPADAREVSSIRAEREILSPPLPVRPPALLLAALTMLLAAGPARAHRLAAAYSLLPDRHIQIEGWFDLAGVPSGARVQVFRSGGGLLAEGRLNEKGKFIFAYTEPEALRVVVNAGEGHRKEFVIPPEKLASDISAQAPEDPPPSDAPNRTVVPEDPWRQRVKDVLLGISFLLALAAFLLSWRNGRKLRSLHDTPPKGA